MDVSKLLDVLDCSRGQGQMGQRVSCMGGEAMWCDDAFPSRLETTRISKIAAQPEPQSLLEFL